MTKTPTPHDAAQAIKAFARELGFDLVGVTRPGPSRHADAYRDWIAAGKHGSMDYLARGLEERTDISRKFPWARSILCVALAYFQDTPPSQTTNPIDSPQGKIARYAWGRDYHKVIERKLKVLEQRIRETFPTPLASGASDEDPPVDQLQIRTYCDTGPILERELAAHAGLGWIGKHTLLIHPRQGSWFLLGEMVLSLDLEPDSPIADHCGTCRRCIEACPTDAITPYSVDATRCISYHTLENRGEIDATFHPAMRDARYLIGCDICQEVCPFNRQPLMTSEADFAPRPPAPAVSLEEVLRWQEQDWDILTRGRALRRAKYAMWHRNAQILTE